MSIASWRDRIQAMKVRVRLAPSPTGVPHIGNTRTALYNYLFARKNHGNFILRIEDTDRKRLVDGSTDKIIEILKFLKLDYDEGPYIQSERLSIYQDIAKQLIEKKKAYYCFCKPERLQKIREEQQAKHLIPRYDKFCLNLSSQEVNEKLKSGEKFVIRLNVPKDKKIILDDLIQGHIEFDSNQVDDQVLQKSDGYPTYHLAATTDDHLMDISHVFRGVEWLSSTPKHILIYEAMNWKLPIFVHLPIILGPDKSKLSKRHGAKSALEYRDEGYLPQAIINFMVFLGWSYKDNSDLLSLEELINVFDIERVRRSNPIFDIKKLDWFNAGWIKKLSDNELLTRLKPYLKVSLPDDMLLKIIPLIKTRITKLTQVNDLIAFFEKLPEYEDLKLLNKNWLEKAKTELESVNDWKASKMQENFKKLIEKEKWKTGDFFMSLRISITGKKVSPPLLESMEILGKNEVILRIDKALSKLNG